MPNRWKLSVFARSERPPKNNVEPILSERAWIPIIPGSMETMPVTSVPLVKAVRERERTTRPRIIGTRPARKSPRVRWRRNR